MKKIILVSIVAATMCSIIACKKVTIINPAVTTYEPSIVGLWKGKYSLDTVSAPTLDVIYKLNLDGSVLVYNGADTSNATAKGSGSWYVYHPIAYVNYIFYSYYNNPSITFFAVWTDNSSYKQINAQWFYDAALKPTGNLVLTKQ